MNLDLSLGDDAQGLEGLANMLANIEEGLGADGIGHGKLRPPTEDQQDSEA